MIAIENKFKGKQYIAAFAAIVLALCVCVVALPSDDVNAAPTATIPEAADGNLNIISYTIDGGAVQYVTVSDTQKTADLAAFLSAVNGASTSASIMILADFSISVADSTINEAALWFTNDDAQITIDGNEHSISVSDITKQDNKNIIGFGNGVEASVSDLSVDGNNVAKHGFNNWNATVTYSNVTSENNYGAGFQVTSSTVTLNNCIASGNGWGDVNADVSTSTPEVQPHLTVTGADTSFTSTYQIYSEVGSDAVTISAPGYEGFGWKQTSATEWGGLWLKDGVMLGEGQVTINDMITVPSGSSLELGQGITGITEGSTGKIIYGSGASVTYHFSGQSDIIATAASLANSVDTVQDIIDLSMSGTEIPVNFDIKVGANTIDLTDGTSIVVGENNRLILDNAESAINVTSGSSITGRVANGTGTADGYGVVIFDGLTGVFTLKQGSLFIDGESGSNYIDSGAATIYGDIKISGELRGNVTLTVQDNATISVPTNLTIASGASLTIDGSSASSVEMTVKSLNIYGDLSYVGAVALDVDKTDNISTIKVYAGYNIQNVNLDGAEYGTTDDGEFQFGDTLNSNYTVTENEYLSRDLTIPTGITLTIGSSGNLNLAGHAIYVYGELVVESNGVISSAGTAVNGANTIYLMRNGTITNTGVIGSGNTVKVSADTAEITANTSATLNYEATGSVDMQNVSGVTFGLANTGVVDSSTNLPEYIMTVTGDFQSAGMSNPHSVSINGVRMTGEIYVGQGVTVAFATMASTLMGSATMTIDGTVDAGNQMLKMANSSSIIVNGLLSGTVAAQTGNYASGSLYSGNTVTTFNANVTNADAYITGYELSVGTYEYQEGTGSDAVAMIAQRLYISGDLNFATTSTESIDGARGTITFGGTYGPIVAEGTSVTMPQNMSMTGLAIEVLGEIQFSLAGSTTPCPVANYIGTYYTVSVTTPARVTTGYIVPFETALEAIGTADNNRLIIMGALTVENDFTLETNQKLDVTKAVVTIDEDAKVTINERATVTGTINTVKGMLTVMNNGICNAPTNYDTYTKADTYVRYCGIVAALNNAQPGETINVTKEVTGVEDLTIPTGVTLNASANITLTGDLVVEQEAVMNMTNSAVLTMDGAESTVTVDGTLDLEEGSIVFSKKTTDNELTSGGNTVMTNDNYTNLGVAINGVMYTNEDSMKVVTSAAAAIAAAAAQDINKNVTVLGNVSAGDLEVTVDMTVATGADANFTSMALSDGKKITIIGELSGVVEIQTGVSGSEAASTIELGKATGIVIAAGSVTDNQGVKTYEMQISNGTGTTLGGTATVTAGTATVTGSLTVTGQKNALNVAVGATIIVGEGDVLNIGNADVNNRCIDSVTVAGTLIADQGTVNIGYSGTHGNVLVSGTFNIVDTENVTVSAGSTLTVTGNLVASTIQDEEGEITVSGTLIIGEKPATVGAVGAGVLSGAVDTTGAGYIKAYAGADLAEALIDVNTAGESDANSTEFYINGQIYMTVYSQNADALNLEDTTSDGFLAQENFSLTGYVTSYGADSNGNNGVNITRITDWYTDADMTTKATASAVLGQPSAVYFKANYATVDVVISVGQGISLYIDNIRMTSGTTVQLAVGSHNVTATVNPGFSGTTPVQFNGQAATGGSFTITADMAPAAYEGTISVTATGDITQDQTVINTGSSDDGMGLTDILLIVLVILIVVMAIIVALRLMRS